MNHTDPVSPPPAQWSELLLYLLVGFGAFLLASLVISQWLPEPAGANVFWLYLANGVCFTGATYLLGIRRGKITWAELGLRPFRWQRSWLFIGVGVALLLLPARALLGLVVQLLLAGNLDSIEARGELIMGAHMSALDFGLTLLGVGLIVPIAEELYFRGLIHTWFQRAVSIFWLRVLASGTIFALGHADSVGVVAASFVIGVVAPIFYEYTRSLAIPIIIHVTTNSFAVIALFAATRLAEFLPP